MAEYYLNIPLKDEDVTQLKIGDMVYFSGPVFTGRSRIHRYIFDEGNTLPFETENQNVMIHVGPVVIKNIKTNMVKDVHLMISNPAKYAKVFIDAGAEYIVFHYEAMSGIEEINALIDDIKKQDVKAGIAIKPNTSVEVLLPFLEKLDMVLIMSVEPGFGGQNFMEGALTKIKYLSDAKKKFDYKYLIEVDGGINEKTAQMVSDAGAEVIVAGTYIFQSENRYETIEELKKL
ncbi:MAG: ribulose-phosphate 3-epimerase [Bacilli bacterium]